MGHICQFEIVEQEGFLFFHPLLQLFFVGIDLGGEGLFVERYDFSRQGRGLRHDDLLGMWCWGSLVEEILGIRTFIEEGLIEEIRKGGDEIDAVADHRHMATDEKDAQIKAGIESAPAVAENVEVLVNGRNVTVNGAKNVVVNDLAGRTVQTSAKSSFDVAQAAGHVVVLQVTDHTGKVSAHKVVLK